MAVRMKLISGVAAVLMPLAACGGLASGEPAAPHSGQQVSNQQSCPGGPKYDPNDPSKRTGIDYLSISKNDLDSLKTRYKDKDGKDLSISYPDGWKPSDTPDELPATSGEKPALTVPGEVPRHLVNVSNPSPFEELKPVDELPYVEKQTKEGVERDYNNLNVRFSDPKVTRIAGCGLTLRNYAYAKEPGKFAAEPGKEGALVANLIAPTIRVKPGQTMKFWVKNRLPYDVNKEIPAGYDNSVNPGSFNPEDEVNLTNFHTHGLRVAPCGKVGGNADPDKACDKTAANYSCNQAEANNGLVASDNVLITYKPGQCQYYEVTVPADHPSGTFWYHPHHHMSTAPQVSSGMAGALIVEDKDENLPPLLKRIRDEGREKILVFQSMLYNDQGRVDGLPEGPQVWGDSGRRITINGQVAPVIRMQPGEIQRWRMISASIHELLRVRLAGHDLNEIALDGHSLPQVDTWKASNPDHGVDLLAGYRSDVLVKASTTPGVYMLVNTPSPWSRFNSPSATEPDRQRQEILAAVVVAGDPVPDAALPTPDEMQKIAYKPVNKPENNLKNQWRNNNLGANDKVKFGTQDLQFDSFFVPGQGLKFSIDGRVYGETATDETETGKDGKPLSDTPRKLTANRIDRWNLNTATNLAAATSTPQGAHIFHIHINPFQVTRVGPNDTGDDKSELVWKDSVVVPAGPRVTVYTQYDKRFLGRFVAHCHLLDHEDAGMMELMEVRTSWPGG